MGLIPCTTHAPVAPSTVDLVLRALRSSLGEELRGRRIAVLGLGPADVRLVDSLIGQGAAVSAHDPGCSDGARTWLGNRALLLDDPYLAATEADALVLSTAWSSERPDLERLRGCMARPLLVDARPARDGGACMVFRFGLGFGIAGLGSSMLGPPAMA